MNTACQNFRSSSFLRLHICTVMHFYDRRALDVSGGMYQCFLSDGTVTDTRTRNLANAARYVVTYSMLYRLTRESAYKKGAEHAVNFLRTAFLDPKSGGYAWVVDWDHGRASPQDATRHAYGMAFVMLAYAHATMCGIDNAAGWLSDVFQTAERFLWEPQAGLYADEATPSWTLSSYRGQNANMHACEAMIAAFHATRDFAYLHRAETLAQSVTRRLAASTNGLIWEHYRADWSVDWDYNRHDSSNKYRPWGYQPGHFTEWAKLLLLLDRHHPSPWHLSRAAELFDAAMSMAWDPINEGIFYALAPDGSVCDADKYHWVQCESFAAAALLGQRTGDGKYWEWYDRIWAYCWARFIDHQHGAWFSILNGANQHHVPDKRRVSAAGYHNIGACHDVLVTMGEI